jgi:trimethylamine:corrinoid methyltransferase-like protein
MKRVVSEKRPDLTEEELRIEEISNAYRTRLKTLQGAKQEIIEDEELGKIQEEYLTLLAEKGWGIKPKKTKRKRKKRSRRKRTRRKRTSRNK